MALFGASGPFRLISTIVTPAPLYDLTDLATVKDELQITAMDGDASLARYISEASKAVHQYCNRTFVVETVLDNFLPRRDGWPGVAVNDLDPLQLSRFPIANLSSVVEDGVTLVSGTDFLPDATLGQLTRLDDEGFPMRWPMRPIAITYDAGFAAMPADIVGAVIRAVSQRWFARGRDPMLRGEKVPGVYEAQWWVQAGADKGQDGNLSPDIVALIDNYRVPVAI